MEIGLIALPTSSICNPAQKSSRQIKINNLPLEWPAKPPLTEGKVSTGVGVMVGRMCFARMCCCAAMADAPFHRRACALRRSPLSFAVQQSAVGAEDIEFVQLMNEKDSRKVARLFRRQALQKM